MDVLMLIWTSFQLFIDFWCLKVYTASVWVLINTYVDLIVIHLSCSSFRVSVKRVSPAFAPAIIPALLTRESVNVDLPWSTWAITDMFRIFLFLSMISRIWSTVKFTLRKERISTEWGSLKKRLKYTLCCFCKCIDNKQGLQNEKNEWKMILWGLGQG